MTEEGSEPDFRLRVRQTLEGVERTHVTRSLVAFLPGEFDLGAPFMLEFELAPGRYWVGNIQLGAPAAR